MSVTACCEEAVTRKRPPTEAASTLLLGWKCYRDLSRGADNPYTSVESVAFDRLQNQKELFRKHGGLPWQVICGT
jgi:hypothetical protein